MQEGDAPIRPLSSPRELVVAWVGVLGGEGDGPTSCPRRQGSGRVRLTRLQPQSEPTAQVQVQVQVQIGRVALATR